MPHMSPEATYSQAWLLWQALGVIGVLLGIAVSGVALWRRINGKSDRLEIASQPLEVRAATEYVTRQEMMGQLQIVSGRLSKIEAQIDAIQEGRHEDLSAFREELRQDLNRVHERIDNLPAQIVALLKNTGAIK